MQNINVESKAPYNTISMLIQKASYRKDLLIFNDKIDRVNGVLYSVISHHLMAYFLTMSEFLMKFSW